MEDLSLHLMDIMQNSVAAGATYVEVEISVDKDRQKLTLCVNDDGRGMSEDTLKKVTNPFYTTRTTRRAGLGIPLFKDAAEIAGGMLEIDSKQGCGTSVTATFDIENIDRKPLGDVPETVVMSIMAYNDMEFHLILKNGESEYIFKTEEIREQIGDIPINDMQVLSFIREMLDEQIKVIFGGILNEITG